ncbi:putative receptor protein kinase [Trifolium repens]|nr:putative receptor protein kinase [Trifolium repens]
MSGLLPSIKLHALICYLLLLIILSSSQLANAANNTQNFHYFCNSNNRGNYTVKSTYHKNLKTLLSNLTSNTKINNYGFYNFSNNQNINRDRVNAIGLCRGDVKPNECLSCLKSSSNNLTLLCPYQKEAIGWYEDEKCMLRYSDRLIFASVMETRPVYYADNMVNATDLNEFNSVVRNLLYNLTSRASSGDSRLKYAAGSTSGPNDQTIYGLVQCTPDLFESQCSDCLVQSIARIAIDCCKDKKGGRVVRPSCSMRFETNFLFYESTAPSPPPPSTINNTSSQGKSNITTVIAIAVPVVAVMVLIIICIYLRVRKSRKKFKTQENEDDEIEISESLRFNFDTIRDATNDFVESNKLGQGGFGIVYKGRLSTGQEIAVKRLSKDSYQGDLQFKNEVLLVAKLQHRNLVRLLGFCIEGRERLLVYEFVPNKSLDYFIFDQTKRAQLNWEIRYKIIAGTARGILYLHEDSRLRIIHRDLKASNILLDEEMNPKIADFGMARLFGVGQTQENTNRIVGTYGYMAPDCIRCGESMEYLLSFVWRNWREESLTNVIDPTLNNESVNEIVRCIHIGLLCVQENAAIRPNMASIVLMLNSHSLTLSRPSEPAFYVGSGVGEFQDYMMKSSEYNSVQGSVNEASITEPYPR